MSQHGFSLAIEFAVQTAFLALALWTMLRLQKLHWSIPGVLGSAALASGLDMIPYVGHYISAAVLLFCIAKLSRPDSYTDVIFTVGIAYALMFCMNLFLLGAMMDDLKPVIPVKADSKPADGEVQSAETTNETNQATAETAPAAAPGDKSAAADPATNQTPTTEVAESATPAPAQPEAKTNEVTVAMSAREIVSQFRFIGVSGTAGHLLAMIKTGTKTETLAQGDSFRVDTARGKVTAHCDRLYEDKMILSVEGGEVTLHLIY